MRFTSNATSHRRLDVRRRALIITLLGTLVIGVLVGTQPASAPRIVSPSALRLADMLPVPLRAEVHGAGKSTSAPLSSIDCARRMI